MARGGLGGVARKVQVTYTGVNPNAAAVTIVKAGTGTADAVGALEQLVFTSFDFISATGGAMSILAGAGVVIAKGTLPASGGGIAQSGIARKCLKATPPTVTATGGGQTDLVAEAEIIKLPS